MKPLDFTKPITTRDGHKVRILCTDWIGNQPVIGLIENNPSPQQWDELGRYFDDGHESHYDLINPPIKRKVEFWVNVYEGKEINFGGMHLSKHLADKNVSAFERRTECLHFTREYEENEGL